MRTLSGTSLSMKTALEGGGEGFDTLAEKAEAARGELEKTDQTLRSLNAADALQRLRDADNTYADAIREAQGKLTSAAQYGDIADAYARYMQEHPSGKYAQGYAGPMGSVGSKEENFYVYAQNQANQPKPVWYSREDKARIQADRDFWAGIVSEMEALGLGYASSVEEISNKMLEFDIAAGTYAEANREHLETAWQGVFDDLYTVMTDGTQFSQLPQFMQQAAIQYYDAYVGGIDQQSELAEGKLMSMAADLTGHVDGMVDYLEANTDYRDLIDRFDELYAGPQTQESVDELNALVPLINEFIAAYNALTETTQDDIPLLPEFTLEGLQAAQQEIEETGEAIAGLNTADIYKGLALTQEEANGFANVLAKLGEGEGQVQNLHDAVIAAARDMAEGLGITDAKEIAQIGDRLLDGLYDTYPGILEYVDTSTGMLLDGWQEGLAHATDPWAELFDKARLEDALSKAQKDMAALDGSALWSELLSPEGKGLYAYAEDWAKALIPDGTAEEVHAHAAVFVEAFFDMFAEIDTEIMGADGRIADGMEGIIATMRRAAHDAQTEVTKLEGAYQSLHADTLAREEAIDGLTAMAGLAQNGDAAGVNSTFEALSTEAVNAIASAMPG